MLARDADTYDQSKGTTDGLSLVLCRATMPTAGATACASRAREQARHPRLADLRGRVRARRRRSCSASAGQGFRAMLDLMNNARLGVAAQAHRHRRGGLPRGRALRGRARAVRHRRSSQQPLVKSMLTQMAINIQAARALLYRTCALLDLTRGAAEPTWRRERRPRATRSARPARAERERNIRRPLPDAALQVLRDRDQPRRHAHAASRCTAASATWPSARRAVPRATRSSRPSTRAPARSRPASPCARWARARMFAALDGDRRRARAVDAQSPRPGGAGAHGIEWIHESMPALMGDPRYALLNAKRVCEMVIDVLVPPSCCNRRSHREEKLGPGDDLHPPPHARGGDERPAHRQRGRVAAQTLRPHPRDCRRSTEPRGRSRRRSIRDRRRTRS